MAKEILCIDDSSTIRILVKKSLEGQDYKITEAEHGLDGLNKAKASSYALIIVDVNMPEMDGFTCVAEIKKLPAYAKTPIVFLTTESSAQKKEMGKTLGVAGWIVKPFEPESLQKIVKMLIG